MLKMIDVCLTGVGGGGERNDERGCISSYVYDFFAIRKFGSIVTCDLFR